MKRMICLLLLCILLVGSMITVQARDPEYDQEYRPQFHYTPKANWMNDPNGLVYNEETKEYHMYYQYCQTLEEDQNKKYWGHAVSKDLVHWQELPVAIGPDELGSIWSGSAVIDKKNTSGLFDDKTPEGARMVALFTYAGGDSKYGFEKVGLAYSKDNGLTWTKHEGNPVIASVENNTIVFDGAFRDPKVIWYEDDSYQNGGIWLMVIAGGEARIFTSENLIDWTYNSTMKKADGKEIQSECPDFYPLEVEGSGGKIKWVYSAAGRSYYVGDLTKDSNGYFRFTAEKDEQVLMRLPTDMYAAQTFFNDPKGRRIAVYWMLDLSSKEQNNLNEKLWDGCQSLPLEMKLVQTDDGHELRVYPVEELDSLISDKLLFESSGDVVNGLYDKLQNVTGENLYIEIELQPGSAKYFDIYVREGGEEKTLIRYNKNAGTVTIIRRDSGAFVKDNVSVQTDLNSDGNIKLKIYVDTSVVDVFTDTGASVQGLIFPAKTSTGLHMETKNGDMTVKSIKIYEMNSAWDEVSINDDTATHEPDDTKDDANDGFSVLYIILIIAGAIAIVAIIVIVMCIVVKKKRGIL